eukprot:jgi/Mesvir1/24784/Mv22035-RA.1
MRSQGTLMAAVVDKVSGALTCHAILFLCLFLAHAAPGTLTGGAAAGSTLKGVARSLTKALVNPDLYTYEIIQSYPHDPAAFTQGLLYHNGTLYESTGLYGKSSVRHVELETGRVLQQRGVDRQYFGEGLALWNDQLIQLTWKLPTAFIYDRATLAPTKTISTPYRDGWGLTHDGTHLILTDSGSKLHFLDPVTYVEVRSVTVRDNGAEITWLNELEYVAGEVWANIWQTDCIARVSPEDGRVLGWLLLHGLKKDMLASHPSGRADVLNGIAWDPREGRVLVTGKLWSRLYELKLRRVEWPAVVDLAEARKLCIHRH